MYTLPIKIVEPAGLARVWHPVAIGVPFPRGVCFGEIFVKDPLGRPILSQSTILARHVDGSSRWVLVEFLASVAPHETATFHVVVGDGKHLERVGPPPLEMTLTQDDVILHTGPVTYVSPLNVFGPIRRATAMGLEVLDAPGSKLLLRDALDGTFVPQVDVAVVEDVGPVRVGIRQEGRFADVKGHQLARFSSRVSFFAGLPLCQVELELHNPRAAEHLGGRWDLGDAGSLRFRDMSLIVYPLTPFQRVAGRVSPEEPFDEGAGDWLLYQDSSGGMNWRSSNHIDASQRLTVSFQGFRVYREKRCIHVGMRAEPTLRCEGQFGAVGIACEDFWQNFPKSLEAGAGVLRLGLFPSECQAGFELQGGEKKRHTFWLEVGASTPLDRLRAMQRPLEVTIAPEAIASSSVIFGFIPEAEDPEHAYVSASRAVVDGKHALISRREVIDEYGWRHYGEVWADHEAVNHAGNEPMVAHYNNQYDLLLGLISHWLRSSDPRWRDLWRPLARHVIDIDLYHTDEDRGCYNHGMFWHTDHYLEARTATHRTFSALNAGHQGASYGGGPSNEHNYSSGLLLAYYLTGDRTARGAVCSLADWVIAMDDGRGTPLGLVDEGPTGYASQTGSPDYHAVGRGAGNSITVLCDAYDVSQTRAYLDKAEELIRRCIHPDDEIAELKLEEVELRWSYLVFLQALGRYLWLKENLLEFDYLFYYARASLLHYAQWMKAHERPYQEVLERVLIPTETWAATDLRKAYVFNLAARYALEAERSVYRAEARRYFSTGLSDLHSFETSHLARPTALLLTHGVVQGYFTAHPKDRMEVMERALDFGTPKRFEPQRARVRMEYALRVKRSVQQLRSKVEARWREALPSWRRRR